MKKTYLFILAIMISHTLLAQDDTSSLIIPKLDFTNSNIQKGIDPDKEVDSFTADKNMMLKYLQDKTQCVQNAANQEQLLDCKVFQSSKRGEDEGSRKKSHKRDQSFGSN